MLNFHPMEGGLEEGKGGGLGEINVELPSRHLESLRVKGPSGRGPH